LSFKRSKLPRESAPLLAALVEQPAHVREMWRYALVLMMIDDEKATAVETRGEDGRTWLTVRTLAGDEFQVVRPQISEDIERKLLEQVRRIVEEAGGDQ
jgi:hypothetical protein